MISNEKISLNKDLLVLNPLLPNDLYVINSRNNNTYFEKILKTEIIKPKGNLKQLTKIRMSFL